MSDKERLEDIKERFAKYEHDYNLNGDDVEWLINRVEELEKRIENLNELTDMQHEQNLRFYKQLNQLIRTNQRYKQALEFYAEREHYKENLISKAEQIDGNWVEPAHYEPPIIYFDEGQIARQALKGE